MANLFVSYSYTARQGGQYYQGFNNMILWGRAAPACPEDTEFLAEETDKHCKESLGMDTATIVILWWQSLDQ